MKRITPVIALLALLVAGSLTQGDRGKDESLAQLRATFEEYSGARLVFEARDLPSGDYHDAMPSLTEDDQVRAAQIAVREVRKLPPGFLGAVGLKGIGIFQACVSRQGDGFRPYDEKLKGYRYYGIWNGKDGVAAAYYSDQQLPLTLHHEIFHHVDATIRGKTDGANLSRDEAFKDAVSGKATYPAAKIAAEDLAALKKVAQGHVLETAVSDYAKKSIGEDKAETARYFLNALPDALVQVATRPELAGSQRMLHVLHKYEGALANGGPGVGWFVDVALGRVRDKEAAPAARAEEKKDAPAPQTVLQRLQALADAADGDNKDYVIDARQALHQAETLVAAGGLDKEEAGKLTTAAAAVTHQLLRQRLQPKDRDSQFRVWGQEDTHGVNWTLRDDVLGFGHDAQRLKKIAAAAPDSAEVVARTQLKSLRLLGRYYQYLDSHWTISDGTKKVFEIARTDLAAALPEDRAGLAKTLTAMSLKALADSIPVTGDPPAARAELDNAYLSRVDAAVEDPKVRAAIRHVQPACVRLGGGSGVNLSADGQVLTCAHVAKKEGAKMTVLFPDGRKFNSVCTCIDFQHDLAILTLGADEKLPFAPVAKEDPEKGSAVVCIGQPGGTTPAGKATNYQPFHVSTGVIRGIQDDPGGDQLPLGRTKHDAWTYWGHSGSPLFNEAGQVVALHNSWDSTTAMRHAVTHQAIVEFLKREKVPFAVGE